jgi:multidrug efflux pump subunit AcrB
VAPVFWLDPKTNVPYPVVMQTPQYRLDSLEALSSLPISSESTETPVMLGGIARINRTSTANVVSHYDIQNLLQIFATPAGRDLGGVARAIEQIVQEMANSLPKGSSVVLLGQYQTLKTTYAGLLLGLVVAIGLIYLLIVVNFQSWTDPFVIVSALPAALAGIVWMLFITRTSVSVPALTGAILCMGVATANSVLVISFARERLAACGDALQAAVEAGFVRCRPVLMTALAMIIGMIPLALGLGEGGEQNAPLGRAVIGGLMFATVSTLWFVPVVFATLHTRRSA